MGGFQDAWVGLRMGGGDHGWVPGCMGGVEDGWVGLRMDG